MAGGVGVDLKLATNRGAVRSVQLTLDAVSICVGVKRPQTVPDDHETPISVHRHCRLRLCVGGVRVDLGVGADRHAIRVVASSLDASSIGVTATRAPARPDHDEFAFVVDGHIWVLLRVQGVGVDLGFRTEWHAIRVVDSALMLLLESSLPKDPSLSQTTTRLPLPS